MEFRELIALAEANLKTKDILKNYCLREETYLRNGPETNFVGRFNLRDFERFGFKFRMIDSEEASTEITLFKRKFKTPILSGALSWMMDIADKPLVKVASGIKDSGSMMWAGITSSEQIKEVIDTGAPTVRIVKPFQDTEVMMKELKEAEEWGAVAVGTDIDFFTEAKGEIRFLLPKRWVQKA